MLNPDALTACRACAAELVAVALNDPDLSPAERRELIGLGFALERLASARAGVPSLGPEAVAGVREQLAEVEGRRPDGA